MGTEYEKDKNCDSTGQKKPVIIVGEQKQEEKKKNSNLSVNSLVFGIISLISIPAIYVSVMLAAVGLISGIISPCPTQGRKEDRNSRISRFHSRTGH
ncbi:MAG: hypothetical protein IJP31_06905 [Lachnospiraceae bacterium]|nr:hypothetical protein [Lachnospiraceae bacterium]